MPDGPQVAAFAQSKWAANALHKEIELATAVSPRADFYRHVNQRWLDELALPPYRAEASMLSVLSEKVQADVSTLIGSIVNAPPGSQTEAERRISALYASFMNEDAIERLGAAVYGPVIQAIESAADREELSFMLGRLQAQGIGGAFDFSVSATPAASAGSGSYVLLLSQSGLGLTAEAMTGGSAKGELLAQYLAHLATMLGHAGVDAAAEVAECVLRLEIELATGHVSPGADGRAARRHRGLASGLAARDAGFAWQAWLAGLGVKRDDAVVCLQQAEFLDAFEAWWSAHELHELKNWLIWRFVHEMVPFGARAVFADNFRFYGQVVSGLSSPRPRPLRVLSFVETFFGDAIGERYVADNLVDGCVDAARELVDELVISYRERLELAHWLRAPTRDAALRKLDDMTFEIGSPARSKEAALWRVDAADLVGNVMRAREAEIARQIGRIGDQPDRSEWMTCAHQATAYYRHGPNHVVIPAAMLQPPLFDPAGDAAYNFAILGSIICHEMAHAFYGLGARYDERGHLRDWWDKEDLAEFSRRTAVLVEQYDQYSPSELPGSRVSGARTLGENVADIMGLTIAQDAYSRHLRSNPNAAPAGRYSSCDPQPLRRFFTCWASMWRTRCTAERMSGRLAWDKHAPSEFRCNGALGHVASFYEAFEVTPLDPMFIAECRRFNFF